MSTAPAQLYEDRVERAAARLWVGIPRGVQMRLPALRGVAGDGHALTAFPPIAVIAPFVAGVLGFGIGALQLGYDTVFTESIVLVASVCALAAFSGHLSLAWLIGFAVGDFLIGETTWILSFDAGGLLGTGVMGALTRVRVPLLITYLLLAAIMLVLPRAARGLLATIGRVRVIPAALAWPVASALYVLVIWQATAAWAAAAPILVRPRFYWIGTVPTDQAIGPLQQQTGIVVGAAIAAAILRQLLILLQFVPGGARDRVELAEQHPAVWGPSGPTPQPRRPGIVAELLTALGSTLVLAGLFEGWLIAGVTFAVFLAVRLVRAGRITVPLLDTWRVAMARLPVVVRLVLLFIIAQGARTGLSNATIGSYTALVFIILAGLVIALALFPGEPETAPAGGAP